MNHGIPAWTLFALSLGGTWQACRRAPDAEQLRSVEAMILGTDSLLAACRAVDTAAMVNWNARFEQDRVLIEARFRDTLPIREAELLGNYHRVMNGMLPATLQGLEQQLGHLDSARTRLEALHHDVAGALASAEQERDHVQRERAALDRSRQVTADLLRRCADIHRTMERHEPVLDALLPHQDQRP